MNSKKLVFRVIVLLLVISLALAILLSTLNATITVLAEPPTQDYYTVFDENGNEICSRGEEVEVGDAYISYDNKKYKIIEVDETTKKCKAQFIEEVQLPNMKQEDNVASIFLQQEKRAGLYITHNDESYILSDGTESIFGAGGIHDVARAFATALRNEGFIVQLDETLHLPHDNIAYTRSRPTAQKLEREFNPDVLFDVHRDGAPRSIYDTVVGGEPMSAVRLVVGQGNPNFEENYQFALEVKALGDEWYPGLVKDIYLGARSYNQDLNPQALLLEFGSEQIEKELVLKSVVPFANVINGVLQRRAARGAFSFERPPATIMVNTQNGVTQLNTIFLTQVLFGGVLFVITIITIFNKKWRSAFLKSHREFKKGVLYQKHNNEK
jgi:stage II sporulation protein P